MDIKSLFLAIVDFCIANNFPDIHLNSLHKPIIRNHFWNLETIEKINVNWVEYKTEILSKDNIAEIIKIVASPILFIKFQESFELDLSYKHTSWDRFRVNCYMDINWYSIAMRKIPVEIPDIDDLWLWETIKEICQKPRWLFLMTWPTWSWKSTNLAAMIDYINQTSERHILTIEDPIEFAFKSKKCLINQREIWNSTKSFADAIRASLREDPDVIMVWEMRDPETIKAAITLAETWHIVFSTLHTNDTVQTIDRIIDVFPATQQDQIRMQLAMSLLWIMSQRLLPRIDKEWRVAAREILLNSDAVRNQIISWKTHQLYNVLEVSHKDWMVLMDKYLRVLYDKKVISKEVMLSFARDKETLWLTD